jgi:hypothetical protein
MYSNPLPYGGIQSFPTASETTTTSTTTSTTTAAPTTNVLLPVLPLSAAQGFGAPMGGGGGGGGDEQAPVAEPTFYEKYKYPIWIALAVGAFFIFKKKKS